MRRRLGLPQRFDDVSAFWWDAPAESGRPRVCMTLTNVLCLTQALLTGLTADVNSAATTFGVCPICRGWTDPSRSPLIITLHDVGASGTRPRLVDTRAWRRCPSDRILLPWARCRGFHIFLDRGLRQETGSRVSMRTDWRSGHIGTLSCSDRFSSQPRADNQNKEQSVCWGDCNLASRVPGPALYLHELEH
ncbi:hypothetical protein P153DRAFT_382029 [Dothidotthia symphoricarpi CBS 119687]|uniref:Uncharacterized protein n=1 Tax=Dothidotthia symphoricarpi CBS 119687 TaxID=1392245 RepID=A0A6A6AQZ7_9PLEO|nr:uncharacterized protein P153DRAFT_382029 [Dothidotthia symphoricarpi CBS 119687]KAF2133598.1 hypothetical protein P153DRAFT_382029 [Dothidotthia symphoricarpi CBS 119687]